MTLVLRHSPAERVLRSVDDHPGIVGAGQPFPDDDAFTFYVSPGWTPSPELRAAGKALEVSGVRGVAVAEMTPSAPKNPVALSLDEVVTACEGVPELVTCLQIVVAVVVGVAPAVGYQMRFEQVRDCAEWGIAARNALVAEVERR